MSEVEQAPTERLISAEGETLGYRLNPKIPPRWRRVFDLEKDADGQRNEEE